MRPKIDHDCMQPVNQPNDLDKYRRTTAPDLEAAQQTPVAAIDLISGKGIPFTLVREAIWQDVYGRICSWFIWQDGACVGYIATTVRISTDDPFAVDIPIKSKPDFSTTCSFKIWRSFITDGRDQHFAPLQSRGLGIMSAAYLQVIRDLSRSGCALASNPEARSPSAQALWKSLREVPGVTIVQSRAGGVTIQKCSGKPPEHHVLPEDPTKLENILHLTL